MASSTSVFWGFSERRWEQFAKCSDELFDFRRSHRFRRNLSAPAVDMVLNWRDDAACRKAAAKLPTRQSANAVAGVPELKWEFARSPRRFSLPSPTYDRRHRCTIVGFAEDGNLLDRCEIEKG